ncbi:hypothetical protein CK203_030921 [Vitis vinifera]|uniref:DUF4283 domain-containing protein n=1 Tax=Vitis vinifera TaxID=29760 RepID=A0A438I1B7_VITVI|nr:hypothetical protein CK203_030921 [Vitis vinifera]
MEEMKKGKKRWFAVDFKSFEVVVEVVKGCFHGRIVGEEGSGWEEDLQGREGLSTLARKHQDLGVTLSFQSAKRVPVYESMLKGCRVKDVQLREGLLKHCLVARRGDFSDSAPDLPSLKRWAARTWSLNGGMKLSLFGDALIVFDFIEAFDKELGLIRGSRRRENSEVGGKVVSFQGFV